MEIRYEEGLRHIIKKMREHDQHADADGIKAAFEFGLQKFQWRNNEPLDFSHNVGVASILADLLHDKTTIIAGLLHNAYNHNTTIDELKKEFGKEVAELINNRNKFEISLTKASNDRIEQTKKLFLALTKDPRLILIELAERLELLRRLRKLKPPERQNRLLYETSDIYIPLAHKLGIQQIKAGMEDLMLKYNKPKVYLGLVKRINQKKRKREQEIEKIIAIIRKKLKEGGINARVAGRVKNLYSIYDKMERKNKKFEEIYDLSAIRIITQSVKNCYEILGIIHNMWKPIPEEFDDYIARPKANNYQSLHTTVITPEGKTVEIQIRTEEMDDDAELGVAAHWKYKGAKGEKYDKKLVWLKEILNWRNSAASTEPIKIGLFENEIFTITPKGEIIELPKGATPLDFAYAVHTEVGSHCSKAVVNGKLVPLSYQLEDADLVEIITSKQPQLKPSWLGMVKTERARTKIKQKLKIEIPKKKIRGGTGKKNAFVIEGNEKKARLAKCCSPVPGDEIVGYITTKRKISVHRIECMEANKLEGYNKRIEVTWGPKASGEYLVELKVTAHDRVGLFRDILNVCSASNINIISTNAKTLPNNMAVCSFEIHAKNLRRLEEIIEKAKKVSGVVRVDRGGM